MKELLEVSLLGLDTPHHPDFVMDQPEGQETYVLMCFSTPFFSRTRNGIETGGAGDCLLHDPPFHQYHGSVPGSTDGFRND